MTYTLKVMKNFKAITMSCILMNQFSRKKRKILRKSRFWVFQQKYTIENLQFLSFAFISVTCPIRVATHHLRYFMLQLVLEFIILQGKQQTTWFINFKQDAFSLISFPLFQLHIVQYFQTLSANSEGIKLIGTP